MIKIKFFMDPIGKIEPWLNEQSGKGYRLKKLFLCIYQFEKTEEKITYTTLFIGANPNKENRQLISMLESFGSRTFRTPLNQGNLAFGKIKLRPYASGTAKIATSFDNYNKEILIVENSYDRALPLLTTNRDISKQYHQIRNAYLQGLLVSIAFLLFIIWKVTQEGYTFYSYYGLPTISLLTLWLLYLVNGYHKLYKKYEADANIIE